MLTILIVLKISNTWKLAEILPTVTFCRSFNTSYVLLHARCQTETTLHMKRRKNNIFNHNKYTLLLSCYVRKSHSSIKVYLETKCSFNKYKINTKTKNVSKERKSSCIRLMSKPNKSNWKKQMKTIDEKNCIKMFNVYQSKRAC